MLEKEVWGSHIGYEQLIEQVLSGDSCWRDAHDLGGNEQNVDAPALAGHCLDKLLRRLLSPILERVACMERKSLLPGRSVTERPTAPS